MGITLLPFIVLIFPAFINRFVKKIGSSSLTYLYSVGLIASFFMSPWWPWTVPALFFTDRFINAIDSAQFVPGFMAPPSTIAVQMQLGGVTIPWAAWLPSILFWWVFEVAGCIFMLSLSNIFRRRIVDVEKVPFPHVMPAYALITYSQGGKDRSSFDRPFLIGLLAGFLVELPIGLQMIFPWFPDIFGWRGTMCITAGAAEVTSGTPLSSIVGLGSWSMNPVTYALSYFIPVNVLLSTTIWFLVYLVMSQVAYMTGYLTGIESENGCGRAWCHPSPLADAPYKFAVVSLGGFIGLAVFYVITVRQYLWTTIQAVLRGVGQEVELEKGEPTSYRTTYSLLLGSLIVLIAMWLAMGMSLLVIAIVVVTVLLFWIAGAQTWGKTGTYISSDVNGMIFLKTIWPVAPTPGTQDFVMGAIFSRLLVCDLTYGWGGVFLGSLASYSLANRGGVSNQNVFKTILAVIAIVPLMTTLGVIVLSYTVGLSRTSMYDINYGDGLVHHLAQGSYYDAQPATSPWYQYAVAGLLIVGALTILHSRFIWFPLDPVGFIIANSIETVLFGIWLPFLVAWVLKTLTLRLGGSKLYERTGIPIAGGFVIGCMVAIFITSLMGGIRFFVPY